MKPFGMWNVVEFLKEVDSTNSYLKRERKENTVVFAETQTLGRGRLGKNWFSRERGNIYMSAAYSSDIPPEKAGLLSIAAGVAALETAKMFGAKCEIKWPNDIVCGGKKLGGILTESIGGALYITGIGINIVNKTFPNTIEIPATSMFIETGRVIDKNEFAKKLLEKLDFWLNNLGSVIETYKPLCANIGKKVKIIGADTEYIATAVDVDSSGALIVQKDEKLITVNSGEVSVRGIYGYI